MLQLLRHYLVIPLKKNLLILNLVTKILFVFGFISYKFHELFRKPYFGFYLFDSQAIMERGNIPTNLPFVNP